MGWDLYELRIHATVDKHGGERQEEQEALWDELREKLEELLKDPKWEPIGAALC
jgi:hypothetical protein